MASALSSCASGALPFLADVHIPAVPVPQSLAIVVTQDQGGNPIELALSACGSRTESGETACLKTALVGAGTSIPALIGLIPGCQAGATCHYTYTTKDRVGFLQSIGSEFVVRWRADVDLTHAPKTIGDVPITVVQIPS